MPDLILTHGEAQYLAMRLRTGPAGYTTTIVRGLRLRLMEASQQEAKVFYLQVDMETLWALDEFLTGMDGSAGPDIRSEKTPAGEPLIDLLDKVQRMLVEIDDADDQDRHPYQNTQPHTATDGSEARA